jgi:hypothetical protein
MESENDRKSIKESLNNNNSKVEQIGHSQNLKIKKSPYKINNHSIYDS